MIDEFMTHYMREIDHYREVARRCADQCEGLLRANGIRAITTFRAKRPDNLRDKLHKRHGTRPYRSLADIYSDIVDLAGVRLALYFPGDRAEVEKLLRDTFDVLQKKQFPGTGAVRPTSRVFTGYGADHYRLKVRMATLPADHQQYGNTPIEVQVASVLMHAWAEVEHDLLYKPRSGATSSVEETILDELNGLVLAGEIALRRLQDAIRDRAKAPGRAFGNHYELAAYLLDAVSERVQGGDEPLMGRVDVLWAFLKKVGLDRPEAVQKYVREVSVVGSGDGESIADQVADEILFENGSFHTVFSAARREASPMSPYREPAQASSAEEEAVGRFMAAWIELESFMNEAQGSPRMLNLARLPDVPWIDAATAVQYKQLRHLRNQVVHGIGAPPVSELDAATSAVRDLKRQLSDKWPKEPR